MQVALVAMVALAFLLPVLVWRIMRRPRQASPLDAPPAMAPQEATVTPKVAKEEPIERPVDPKMLPDGRPRCQASVSCTDAATRHRPLVMRDDGWTDLVRRAFGAPDRLRLDAYQAPFLGGVRDWFAGSSVDARTAVVVPEFCEEHAHLAWEEARAELADIEYGRVKASRDDQARLAYFAKAGLMERVASRILQVEAEEKRAKKGGRRAPAPVSNVTPIRAAAGEK